ncbi:MAG: hypothetical protein NTV75_05025 [Bacteroidia bacterium]|nr:hypothetical protein [Bacteroidia bacterium]
MKTLTVESMELIEGGGLFSCAAAVVSTGLFFGTLLVIPGPGWALGLYLANAVLGPTLSGIGLATGCFGAKL